MKFWKILRKLLDEIFPDWQDKFISYKDLKQQLKLIYPMKEPSTNNLGNDQRPNKRPRLKDMDGQVDKETVEMKDFCMLLVKEIKKINGFFMDKEELCIIRTKLLKAEVCGVKVSKEELNRIGRKIVDFHGEMILLKNYSALNYIGLLKILKKYEKRSGNLIRLPFIEKVLLHEPFLRTEVLSNLVDECEIMIRCIFPKPEQLAIRKDTDQAMEEKEIDLRIPKEFVEIECIENVYLRLSKSALRTMKQIRSGSSTVDMFSLPPMEGSEYI
ncbi:hypothetical protein ACJIZ3_001709 [Penstemon smallii]|uniref:SPX domain-containing protein n=1 Tax=Penstemon smallii TaxID=265156 RepID=A0ABD3U656_9LAMI